MNPNSAFYLSIRIGYPNAFDVSKTELRDVKAMGGDIFIHGQSATIGCIPIGDKAIEEVFILCAHATKGAVKVVISPRDFRKKREYPSIEGIAWERELYDIVSRELDALPIEDGR